MNKFSGFICNVEYTKEELKYDYHHDGFSVYIYEDNNLLVCVQTSIKEKDEALWLANKYRNEIGEFTPPRETNGSFIIVDKSQQSVFAGRDRTQAYHLYYSIDRNIISISTDIRAFLDKYKTLDAVSIDATIMNGYAMAQFPVVKEVESLMPGIYFTCNKSFQITKNVYWNINKVEIPDNYDDAIRHYANLLTNSIRANISNDTATVFLSGGSDSAAVMGALNKLRVGNIHAVHMSIKNNYEFEDKDVLCLRDKYNFNLQFLTPRYDNKLDWKDYVNKTILEGSINSAYVSFPAYHLMGDYLSQQVPKGTTVFNGEFCLLDIGFTESGDTTRGLRRWFFMEGGRKLSSGIKIWPDFLKVNWENNRRPYYIRDKWGDKIHVLNNVTRSFLHSIGRPAEYFAGLKMGFMGFPGYYLGQSLLPQGYKAKIENRANEFFNNYVNGLCSKDWKTVMATMTSCWYSEASNFTMPTDVASYGGLTMCFPFSSVELMDYASSLPTEWCIDKKIQKDACKIVFDMPDQVAYRMKNHRQPFDYFGTLYGSLKEEMIKTIYDTDFGPLNDGIRMLLEHKQLGLQVFDLYCYAIWIRNYNLKVE